MLINEGGRLSGRLVAATAFLVVLAGGASAQTATIDKVQAALPRIEAMAIDIVEKGLVPGLAIGIVSGDKVVYLGGFGVRDEGKSAKVDADTVFQLASFSKPMAAAVVAALVGEGAVSWDSKIVDLDPLFRLQDPYPTAELTVRDLFSHRSGLPGYAGNELEQVGFDRTEILHRLRFVDPASSFRTTYSYSNFGLTAGGVSAAAGAGLVWEEAADEKLYDPLGMGSTSSRDSDFLTRSNRSALHIMVDGAWRAALTRDPDAQSPAGGVSSNIRDLVKWLTLEMNEGKYEGKQVIAAEALAATHRPVVVRGVSGKTGRTNFYGLGWTIDYGPHGEVWDHAGGFSVGARTIVSILPNEKLGIIVLSNAFPSGVPEAIVDSFYDIVLDGEPSRDWIGSWNGYYDGLYGAEAVKAAGAAYAASPAGAAPPLPLSAYAGTYANDYVGDAVVSEEGGRLILALGPEGKKRYPLSHFDRDTFVLAFWPETLDLMSPATFAIGPDGKTMTLTLEDFSVSSGGILSRKPD